MTPIRVTRLMTVSVLGTAMALAGMSCGTSPTTSTSVIGVPSVPLIGVPSVPYRIAAHVFAPDRSAVGGARVEVLDGPYAGIFCETDQNGECTLSAMFTSAPTPEVRTTKDGFIPKSARFPASAIQGNPVTMYFGLEPTAAPAMIAGVYTMTVTASSTCTDLPADVRTRTNTATIRQDFSDPSSVDIIPSGDSPGDFYGGVLDNSVGLLTDPDSQFPYPSEVVLAPLDSGRFLVANGTLTGRITGSTIDTILDGDLGVAERPFLTALATCRAADHRLTFVRQSNGEMRAVQTRGLNLPRDDRVCYP